MEKVIICKFLDSITILLAHPNEWIRYGVAQCVSALAQIWSAADVHCNLIPKVKPFLAKPAIQIHRLVSGLSLSYVFNKYNRSFIKLTFNLDQVFDILHNNRS